MRKVLLTFVLGVLFSSSALAQSYAGTVYGVYPEGVMLNQGGTSVLVPTQHATFSIGGIRATWSSLVPGQAVTYAIPQACYPTVHQIADPYAWKMKYHPTHPHGGPPGQTKKLRSGNHKGKGKWK